MGCTSASHLVIAFVTLLSLAQFLTTAYSARTLAAATTTNTEFIRTSCGATAYPRLCFASLESQATIIRNDPKLLANAALSVSLATARTTSAEMVKVAQGNGLTPREVGPMHDCLEQLADSVDDLQRSMVEMEQIRGSNYALFMSDIQTWVSAAMTDDDTCTGGLAENAVNGNTKVAVRERVLNIAHLTSNALALINSYASLHG